MKASTYKCFRLYGRLIMKKRTLLVHIQFLTRCQRKGLTPKFININTRSVSESSKSAIIRAKKFWLAEEIKCKHTQLAKVEEQLYSLHLMLLKQVEYHSAAECVVHRCVEENKSCWQNVLSRVGQNLCKRMRELKQRHKKKLFCLMHTQATTKSRSGPKQIDNFVINFSSTQFSKLEMEMLNKGFNYAISSPRAPTAEIINNIETAIQFNDPLSKSALRNDVKQCLMKKGNKNAGNNRASFEEWCTARKMKQHSVIYSRADKGNKVVIMDKEDYDSRVLKMIDSGPYEEWKYKNGKPKNPLNTMIEETFSTRQRVAHLMGDEFLNRKLLVPNAKVASLYCLPKIHKNPLTMRPICSNISTPTEKMAAWLVKELNKYPVNHGKSVKNSIELVKQLENLEVRRGEILVSFDVASLFPSVPIQDALQSLREHLERNRVPPNHTEAYILIAKQCMSQNFFMFRSKIYKQTFGLSMGSKISPIMAELFMSDFEVQLKTQKYFPRVWHRYVDDVFAVVKERYLSQTLNLLNSHHATINFTVEREVDGKLPFLDLLIHRKENGTLKYGIYRKPTSTDRYITCDSNHFGTQKQAAFHSMIHRLINIPMEKEDFEKEKMHIYKAGELNGYEPQFVQKIIKKHERKKHLADCTTLQPEREVLKRISLPFYPKITNKIKNILRRYNIEVVHKSKNTLREILFNAKDKIPSDELSGIYEVPCSDCAAVYIGQSRRKIKIRLKEHKNAVKSKKVNESSVAAHAVNNNHNIDWSNAKLIKNVTKAVHLNAWESMFITTAERALMNEDDPPIISPLFRLKI